MNFKITSALALAVCGVLGMAAPRSSSAAAGDVAVNVTITNGITMLYYNSALNVTIDAATLSAAIAPPCTAGIAGVYNCDSGSNTVTATVAGSVLTAPFTTVATTPVPGTTPAAMSLLLQNVWAVRALGGSSANTTVTATLGTNTILSNGTSTIKLNPLIGVGTGAAAPALVASPSSVVFPDPGLAVPTTGSVILSLDLTNAIKSGAYVGAGAQQYTIAVTAT